MNILIRAILFPLLIIKMLGHGLILSSDFLQEKLAGAIKDDE